MANAGTPRTEDDPNPFAEANNAFALAIYEQVRRAAGNVVFSPFNLRVALGTVARGAAGVTAAEMRRVLRMSGASEDPPLAETIGRLTAWHAGAEIVMATSLWGQEGVRFQAPFVEGVAGNLGASIRTIDFHRDPEAARATINGWIGERTNGRFPAILGPGAGDRPDDPPGPGEHDLLHGAVARAVRPLRDA